MKVLLVLLSDSRSLGGLEKHTLELAGAFAKRGLSMTLAAAPAYLADLPDGVGKIPLRAGSSRNSPALLLTLYRAIRTGGFDLVHAQGTKAAYAVARLAPFLATRARVATIHGFKSRYPKTSHFHQLISVSRTLAEDIGPGAVAVYNGLTLSPTDPAASASATAFVAACPGPVWLAAGRLVPVKGFRFLIDSFQFCTGTLLIAGEGPERAALEAQIATTGQSGKVRLIGHQTRLNPLMTAVDGVVISSQREGFSYVCAEALLLGKPVIATDVPIASEFLPPGHLVRGDNPREFARLLSQNPHTLAREQASARQAARAELSFETMVDKTLAVYRKAVNVLTYEDRP